MTAMVNRWHVSTCLSSKLASLVAQTVKTAYRAGDPGSTPGWGRFPQRREWLPTPALLTGEPTGRGAWQGPWGGKESDRANPLSSKEHVHSICLNISPSHVLWIFGRDIWQPRVGCSALSEQIQASVFLAVTIKEVTIISTPVLQGGLKAKDWKLRECKRLTS